MFMHMEHLKLEDCEINFHKIVSSTLRSLNSVRTSLNAMVSLKKTSIHLEFENDSEEYDQLKLIGNLINVTTLELSGFNKTMAACLSLCDTLIYLSFVILH
jgi:hypothetical protein